MPAFRFGEENERGILGSLAIGDRSIDKSGGRPSASATERVRAAEAERYSLASILRLLRSGGPATRLDLERKARLGRAVIADRLVTLEGFGLIQEGGVGRSIGGRAPRLVRFRSEAANLVVANIDSETIGVGLADLDGRLIFEHYEDFNLTKAPRQVFDRLEALFNWALENTSADVWGISLGLPTAPEQAVRLSVPTLVGMAELDNERLIERLIDRYRIPIWAHSAVRMETLGELEGLAPDRRDNIIYVDLGQEISAGMVVDGRLGHGAHGLAGQIGHIYAGGSRTCGCGNAGCLRTIAGCEAIVEAAREAALGERSRRLADRLAQSGTLTIADIGAAARLGDAFSAELLARAGRSIGTVLAAIVNALNPSMIVVGGELSQTGDICLAAIREGIYRHTQPQVSRDLAVVQSRIGRLAGLRGAAQVALSEIFDADFLEDWIAAGTPRAHSGVVELIASAQTALAKDR